MPMLSGFYSTSSESKRKQVAQPERPVMPREATDTAKKCILYSYIYSVTRPQTQRRKPNHESWSLVLRQTLRTLIMYKHDGLLYYQAGHYGTERACLRVTSLVTVTHERGGLLRRDFIYIQVQLQVQVLRSRARLCCLRLRCLLVRWSGRPRARRPATPRFQLRKYKS